MPCTLTYTDERFIYSGKSFPNVPLLVDSSFHFVEPVCDYLRFLVIKKRLALTSVRTYAEIIQAFWNYLEKRRMDYSEITDADLHRWTAGMEDKGNKDYVSAQRCDAVFELYCWMEETGRVNYIVKVPGVNDKEEFTPRLTSMPSKPHRYRSSRYGIVWAYRPQGNDIDQVQYTPTAEDLTALYIAADKSENLDLTDRNHLLIDWYGQVGLRRMEAVHLTIDQIPSWPQIDELQSKRHVHELLLTTTKGGRQRSVGVLPNLLAKTREWIEGPRAVLVQRFKAAKGKYYKEPAEIFISAKTGERLTVRAVSNYFTSIFDKANVDGHGHRIRAHYLQKLIDAEIDAAMAAIAASAGSAVDIDWELIIRKVAERAGHKDIKTIRKYITLVKKKHSRKAGRDDVVTIAQLLAAQEQKLAILEHRIAKKQEELKQIDWG